MQHVEVSATIDAPRETVWSVYTDHVGWQDWAKIGKVRLARQGQPAPNGVGCVRVIANGPIAVHEEILTYDPPTSMTYRVIKGGLPMRDHLGEVVFSDTGEGTLIVWRCRFESRVPLLGSAMRWIVMKVFTDTLRRLRDYPFEGARKVGNVVS